MIWSEIRAFSVLIADSTGVNSRRYRKKAFEAFDDKLYRKFRGVIEGIFGGLENRRLLFTRYKKNQ